VTRLSSSAREKLYDAEAAKAEAAGLGSLPICNICGDPIDGTRERWHESHDPKIPKHMGGAAVSHTNAATSNTITSTTRRSSGR